MGNNDYGTDAIKVKPAFPKWAVLAVFAAASSAVWTGVVSAAIWRFLSGLPLANFVALDTALWNGAIPFAAYSLAALSGIVALSYAFSYGKPFPWTYFAVCLFAGVWASAFFSAVSLAFSDRDSGNTYYSLSQIRKWECSDNFAECSSSFGVRTSNGVEIMNSGPVKTLWMSAGDALRTVSSKRSETLKRSVTK